MKTNYRTWIFILAGTLFFYYSCSKSSSNPSGGANTSTIDITGRSFPATTTITKGTTITWANKDVMAHTVTSDDGTTFSSGNVAVGAKFSYTANTPGTFSYHCNYHSNMTGTLVVTP